MVDAVHQRAFTGGERAELPVRAGNGAHLALQVDPGDVVPAAMGPHEEQSRTVRAPSEGLAARQLDRLVAERPRFVALDVVQPQPRLRVAFLHRARESDVPAIG